MIGQIIKVEGLPDNVHGEKSHMRMIQSSSDVLINVRFTLSYPIATFNHPFNARTLVKRTSLAPP